MSAEHSLRSKLIHEIREMAVIAAWLTLCFGAVTTYRLMLPEPPAPALTAYGFALVKALVLAKVILLGRMLPITKVFDDRPLIVPTLYKVVLFGALTLVFETIEHLLSGVIHGRQMEEVIRELVSGHVRIILARTLVVLSAFVPFFAFVEASRILGGDRLRAIFLRRRAD